MKIFLILLMIYLLSVILYSKLFGMILKISETLNDGEFSNVMSKDKNIKIMMSIGKVPLVNTLFVLIWCLIYLYGKYNR